MGRQLRSPAIRKVKYAPRCTQLREPGGAGEALAGGDGNEAGVRLTKAAHAERRPKKPSCESQQHELGGQAPGVEGAAALLAGQVVCSMQMGTVSVIGAFMSTR